MEIYLPTFESQIVALVSAFRFIVFAILVAGLITAVVSQRLQSSELLGLLARATVIVAAIAYEDVWFPKVEQVFLTAGNYINPGFSDHPTSAPDQIRKSVAQNPNDSSWSWRKLSESLYQSLITAGATVFVYLGTLVTVPMLILQYILKWLLYLLTPFALAIMLIPQFRGLGVRFIQQLLAVLAWPVGFAITDLVALSLWKDFTASVNPSAGVIEATVYAPVLVMMGAILGTIMIIIGMVSTPIVMQMLFAQGHAFSGGSVSVVSMTRHSASLLSAENASRKSGSRPTAAPTVPSIPPPAATRPTI